MTLNGKAIFTSLHEMYSHRKDTLKILVYSYSSNEDLFTQQKVRASPLHFISTRTYNYGIFGGF